MERGQYREGSRGPGFKVSRDETEITIKWTDILN
jgi:hypothetical protein